MSLHEQARKLIDQAQTAIQAGNPEYATELLRQSITYYGKNADAYVVLGIALAQTKMPGDAENAFKKATQMAPDNVKARYNLAVHQYSQGQMQAALNNARKATEIDVLHKGSQELVSKIEAELGIGPGELPKTTVAGNPTPAPEPTEIRDGYGPFFVETIPFIKRLGIAWNLAGWSIAVLSLVLAIFFITTILIPNSGRTGSADAIALAMNADPKMGLMKVLYVIVNLGGVVFVGADAVNRRGNLLWLLPQIICGFGGFTFLILPVYLIWGQEKEGNVATESSVK